MSWRTKPSAAPASQRNAAVFSLLLCLLGAAIYAYALNHVYPIRHWLFWQLAVLWAWVALFNAACASFGQFALVRWLGQRDLPALESGVLGMAVGVIAFTLGMYAGGALALYGKVWAVALPLAMLAVGAPHGLALLRRLIAEFEPPVQRGPLAIAISACGVLCLAVVYLGLLNPDSINYDAGWHHLTVAQDYARHGRIIPFPADYGKNLPQLASLIHTWGWQLPGMTDPLRWMLVLHQEFGLFLWTLAGVAAAIRMLVQDSDLRGAWVAFFLFPIIFVYDDNLGGSADHVCGFFSVPVLLAALRYRNSFSLRDAALLAVVCTGDCLTKYQAVYLIASVFAVIGVAWLRKLAEHRRPVVPGAASSRVPLRDLWLGPLVIAGLMLALFSPHLLRGLIFFKNPVYPMLRSVFPSTPNAPLSAYYFDNYSADPNYWVDGSFWERSLNALRLVFTFSLEPHYSFTHDVPSFGSLFTLLMPAVLLVPNRSRIAPALWIAVGAVFVWGYVYFVDRNLQTFMPVLVAVTGALIVSLWRLGRIARFGLVPLVALQIVWGGDALFYSSYDRIKNSMELIKSGYDGRAEHRYEPYRAVYLGIRKELPKHALLLIHTSHMSLGIDRDVVLDWANYQALITYAHIHTPRELYDYFHSLGITHLMYELPMLSFAPSKQEEVVWNALITGYAKTIGQFGPYRLARMPSKPPPAESPYRVATLGIFGYADGIYPIETMGVVEYIRPKLLKYPDPPLAMPADAGERVALLKGVNAVFVGNYAFDEPTTAVMTEHFKPVLQLAGRFVLYLRKEHVHHVR